MNKRRLLGAAGLVVAVAACLWFARAHVGAPAVPGTSWKARLGAVAAESSARATPACDFSAGWVGHYQYEANVEATEPGTPPMALTAQMSFEVVREATTAPGGWVLLGEISDPSPALVDAHGADFTAAFLVRVGPRCEVLGFARQKATPRRAARGQQALLHDFWLSTPEVEGELDRRVQYSNGTGLANATFTRAQGRITRLITSYEMGWATRETPKVHRSRADAVLGHGWLESFESVDRVPVSGDQAALVTTALRWVEAPQAGIAPSVSRDEAGYVWEDLLPAVVATPVAMAVPAAEQRYVEAMKNETIDRAFTMLASRAAAGEPVEGQWHEMAGYLNGHPEQIAEFAGGLRKADFPVDQRAVSYLVLSRVIHPQAREALLSIRRDTSLPPLERVRANLALVTRPDVGVALAREMSSDALRSAQGDEGALFARNTLLHVAILGASHRADEEVQQVVASTLQQALAGAGIDPTSQSHVFAAIGNAALPEMLSDLEPYTHTAPPDVRALVPRAIRGYPYARTEAMVVEWLERETSPEVKQEIFDAIYHQLADAQRHAGPGVVREALAHLAMEPRVFARQSIIHILGPCKDEYPGVKVALARQLAVEYRERSGLYSQIGHYLEPRELDLALSLMPEFSSQYGMNGADEASVLAQLGPVPPDVRPQTARAAEGER